MIKEKGFFIGTDYISNTDELHEIKNPFDGITISKVFMASERERESAVKLAHDSYEKVSKNDPKNRISLLAALKKGIEKRFDEIANTITLEAGKPVRYSRAEIKRALQTIDLSIEAIKNPDWKHISVNDIPDKRWRYALIQRFPIGPVLGITPFNFPVNLVMHKLAPAIAAGCPFILKPASQVISTALVLGEILHESSAIPGQISILPMSAEKTEPLINDDRIKFITFTGSDVVGWNIKKNSNRAKVSLELGGNAGCIIEPDSDLEYAAGRCVMGAFAYQGQVCISLQRLYIHEAVYDKFIMIFLDKISRLKYGDPLDEATDIGPMISIKETDRVLSWIDEAADKGAVILSGGQTDGSIIHATVIENPSSDTRVVKDEVFGPVVSVFKYKDFEDALECVKGTRYGLQAGIFTRDIEKAYRSFSDLRVGGVMINEVPTFRFDAMPYGGSKESGIGREGPHYAIEEMTEPRIMVVVEP